MRLQSWIKLLCRFRKRLFLFCSVVGVAIYLLRREVRTIPPPLKWWQQDIIYQVYPRSLMDSDGDGIGDLKGIESRIDHFVELGIGTLWLSPIFQSPMKDFGYDISNFTAIEPLFGSMDDFRSLSHALREKGIKLVLDFVPNHSSDVHPWFNSSVHRVGKYADYYVWRDPQGFDLDGKPILPNNWVSRFGGSAWTWNEIRRQFYYHKYAPAQPDLNYESPQVLKDMLAVMRFWLEEGGVDGFRMDAVPSMFEDQRFLDEPEDPDRPADSIPSDHKYWDHVYTWNLPGTRDALREFRKLLDSYTVADGRERVMMVEAYVFPLEDLFLYYGTEERPIAHFPFNFELVRRLVGKKNWNGSDIAGVVTDWMSKMPPGPGRTANWLVGNHDRSRVASRFGPSLVDPFNMLILLLPGSAVTYYGEEIGMEDTRLRWEETVDPAGRNAGPERYHLFSRDPQRTPMQWSGDEQNAGFSTTSNITWLPINPNYKEVNVQVQRDGVGESHLKVYKRCAALRKTDIWKYGSLEAKAIQDGAGFGFARIFRGKGFIVLINFSNSTTLTINAGQEFEGIGAVIGTVYATSVHFQPETALLGSDLNMNAVVIGPKHSLILEF